jgi:5'(3')-deoxyribonucleotidase
MWNHYHNTNHTYNPNVGWEFENFIENRKLTPEEYNEVLGYFEDELFYRQDILVVEPYAIQTIKKLVESGCEVVICTRQFDKRQPLTTKWVKDTFGDDVQLIFAESFDKSFIGKCDIFIDDRIDCLKSMSGLAKCIWCYSVYDWNKEWQGARVYNWNDIWVTYRMIVGFRLQMQKGVN